MMRFSTIVTSICTILGLLFVLSPCSILADTHTLNIQVGSRYGKRYYSDDGGGRKYPAKLVVKDGVISVHILDDTYAEDEILKNIHQAMVGDPVEKTVRRARFDYIDPSTKLLYQYDTTSKIELIDCQAEWKDQSITAGLVWGAVGATFLYFGPFTPEDEDDEEDDLYFKILEYFVGGSAIITGLDRMMPDHHRNSWTDFVISTGRGSDKIYLHFDGYGENQLKRDLKTQNFRIIEGETKQYKEGKQVLNTFKNPHEKRFSINIGPTPKRGVFAIARMKF